MVLKRKDNTQSFADRLNPEVAAWLMEIRAVYNDAIRKARKSADLTTTPKFVEMVEEFRRSVHELRKAISVKLRYLLAKSEGAGLAEDEEKSLGEIKKESQEIRSREENFYKDVLHPLRASAEECSDLLTKIRGQAISHDSQFELAPAQFLPAFEAETSTWERASWDAEKCVVEIVRKDGAK